MGNNPDYAPGEYEIIIGNADREEVRSFLADLRLNDWGYGIVGKKLIIAGRTDQGTLQALDEFTSRFLETANPVFFDSADASVTYGSYLLDHVIFHDTELKEFSIVYPEDNILSEKAAAELLRDTLLESYGYQLPVVADAAFSGKYAILIGKTAQVSDEMLQQRNQALPEGSEEQQFYLAGTKGQIWLDAERPIGLMSGVRVFAATYLQPDSKGEKRCTLDVGAGSAKDYVSIDVSSMSFNVYYQFDSQRAALVVKLIRNYMPDTFGLQEATPTWMNYLKANLGDVYDYVGEGRNGGNNGEYNPVFYKKDRFTLVEGGTKWLSPTPSQPNSSFPDASLPRIMTYAVLRDNANGEQIMHVNTHLGIEGDDMREKQINVLVALLKEMPTDIPFIVTGDYNWSNTDTLSRIMETVGCVNSAEVTAEGENLPTFPGSSQVIDYLYISSADTGVAWYQVCNEQIEGAYPSDHFPVYVEWFTLKK